MKTKLHIFLTAIAGGLISAMPARAASMFGNQGLLFEEETKVEFEFLQSNGAWKGSFGVMNLGTGVENILLEENRNFDAGQWWNDNLGTAGETVLDPLASFTFEAGEQYSFFLRSDTGNGTTTQYSTTSKNDYYWFGSETVTTGGNNYDSSIDNQVVDRYQRALFSGDLFSEDGVNIFWEDNTAWGDNDFDDFVVKATSSNAESTPEPATLAGLGCSWCNVLISLG
jgi:hypothetical protein